VATWSLGALTKFVLKVAVLLLVLVIVFHERLINDVYKNVEDLNDGEMPTTVTSYPSGPEVVSIIGGSGDGLNCSLPPLVDLLFDGSQDQNNNRHLVRQRFRQACVFHDLCYRHGLATYGYTQNDCDRILQNHAFRLCQYVINKKDASDRCQRDSKKILAGVSLRGYGAYRGWDRSTYFEFDSDPARANKFTVSRVVDHPFKSIDPVKYHDEAQQIILTFANENSNLTVDCATCNNKTILEWTQDPNAVSPELRSVGFRILPEALLQRSLSLSATKAIWLPPRRHHSAPHLLVDDSGKHHLVWMSRSNVENTAACIILSDAGKLLTYTLPKREVCNSAAGSQLTMVEAEMFSPSSLPMVLPGARAPNNLLATALTPQRDVDHSLRLCLWSESLRARGEHLGNDNSVCTRLRDARIDGGNGLGAFQNFPVIRPGQQIFFARDVALPAGDIVSDFFKRASGNPYSTGGSILVVDVAPPNAPNDGPGTVTINRISHFEIDDSFDPMMPITDAKDNLKFLSVRAADSAVGVYLSDFAVDDPVSRKIEMNMDGVPLRLHPSWALRPTLVVESKEPTPKTKLIFSRGHVVAGSDQRVDAAWLEVLVVERNASDPQETPFSVSAAAACKVQYRFESVDSARPCGRAFDQARAMRPSPAAMISASQLLVGRFARTSGLAIAFTDRCLSQHPIVLASGDGGRLDVDVTDRSEQALHLRREIDCQPVVSRESIGDAVVD